MKHTLSTLFILFGMILPLGISLRLHSQNTSEYRSSRLFSEDFDKFKEFRVRQGHLHEALDFIRDNNLQNIQTTYHLAPFVATRNATIESGGEIFPKVNHKFTPEIDYRFFTKEICWEPLVWNCEHFERLQDGEEVLFENHYFRITKII